MGWLFILLLKFLLFSGGTSRNPLNPCHEVKRIRGRDFVDMYSWSSLEEVAELNFLVKSTHWLDRNFVYVDCSRRGLTEVPRNLPTNVEALNLDGNVIRRVKANDFAFYPNVSLLGLARNCLALDMGETLPPCNGDLYIEPGALHHLVHLKWLDVCGNILREFPRQLPLSIGGLDISVTLLPDVTAQLRALPRLQILFAESNCFRHTGYNICPRNFTLTKPLSSNLIALNLINNNWKKVPKNLLGDHLKYFSFALNAVPRLKKDDFMNAPNLQVLDLSLLGSTVVEALVLDKYVFDPLIHLRYLNLSWNFFEFLPNGIFRKNKNLEILDISGNCLKTTIFEPKYLFNLSKLRYVDFSFNNMNLNKPAKPMKSLRLGKALASLSSLETIIFGTKTKEYHEVECSVQFHEIDNQSFANLSNLTHLSTIDISYCNVHHISSDAWSGLRHLKSIRASNNLFTFSRSILVQDKFLTLKRKVFGDQFAFLDRFLKHRFEKTFIGPLDLKCNKTGLLDYSNNEITAISGKKELLLSMTTILDLSQNQLKAIRSDDLRHLINLCSIDLSHNPINRIDPFTFSSLSSLRQIDFINEHKTRDALFSFLCHLNPLAEIKLRFELPGASLASLLLDWDARHQCELNPVIKLNIAHNHIAYTFIERGIFAFLPELRHLVLNDCHVPKTVPEKWFEGLNHLETLDLSHNNLATFPSTPLKATKNLSFLGLDYNNIIEFKGNLSFLVHLKKLTIAHNKIRFIQLGFFSHINLETLDLSHNFINQLDSSIFGKDVLNSLQYLDIRWNELDCFCHEWQEFYRWYISDASDNTELPGFYPECTSNIDQYYGGCVACHSPLNLRGRPVSRYGFNTSCDLQTHLKYTIAFTIFFVLFMLCGSVGYSKWFKRFIFRKVNEYFRVQALKPSDVSSRYSTMEGKKAFVFFDHSNDELGDWVDDKLVPGMINGNPSIELLLAGRDIDAGAFSIENLLQLVRKCRKTIVIFSGIFCNSPNCSNLFTFQIFIVGASRTSTFCWKRSTDISGVAW
ncbi:toll-like receptor 7 isoform X2 [Clavelina lepadiformis]|uniref:toll-like receptor 7 isoform X2 n=1 Tax=Clavelina lepadiformis TaxID=159417 RepID=UPI0040422D48